LESFHVDLTALIFVGKRLFWLTIKHFEIIHKVLVEEIKINNWVWGEQAQHFLLGVLGSTFFHPKGLAAGCSFENS